MDKRFKQRHTVGSAPVEGLFTLAEIIIDISQFLNPSDLDTVTAAIRNLPINGTLDLSSMVRSQWMIERTA